MKAKWFMLSSVERRQTRGEIVLYLTNNGEVSGVQGTQLNQISVPQSKNETREAHFDRIKQIIEILNYGLV